MKRVAFHASALFSGLLLLGCVYMLVVQPKQIYVQDTQHHQYSLVSTNGRAAVFVVDLVWPPPTSPYGKSVLGLHTLISLPIWPMLLLAAVLPAWWLWQFRNRQKPSAPQGFPMSESKRE